MWSDILLPNFWQYVLYKKFIGSFSVKYWDKLGGHGSYTHITSEINRKFQEK